jgi:exopolysaccharide/PEP-CTERM locus tyrosine autokinase
MSNVERALKKLRESMAAESAAKKEPVARVDTRVTAGTDRRDRPGSHRSIVFDLDALTKAGLLSPANRALAEQYRAVKQPLLRNASQDGARAAHANMIMVTSALASEGKTFTCVNLSLSLAMEKDWEVLLLDCDCKNPQLSRLLGVQDEPGLLDLLKDRALRLDSLILSTNVPGLSMLPLGRGDAQAAELLASDRMREICGELATAAPGRLAVFDSSPLLLTSESTILSHHVGQVVVVVHAGKTPQMAVKEAVGKLDTTKPVGLVLNRVSPRAQVASYGGYGYYGHSVAP